MNYLKVKKYFKNFFVLVGIALLWGGIMITLNQVEAQKIPVLELFHGAECPHCHEERAFLPIIQKMYPDLAIREYEIWHDVKNRNFAEKRLSELGEKLEGVPTNIIENQVIVGFQKEKLLNVLQKTYGPPQVSLEEALQQTPGNDSAKKWLIVVIVLILVGGGTYFFFADTKK